MNPTLWEARESDAPRVRRMINLVEMSQTLVVGFQRSASIEQVHAALVAFARRGGQDLDPTLAQECWALDEAGDGDDINVALRRAYDIVMCEIRRIAEEAR